MNKDIAYALAYHKNTKHSEISVMNSRHYLDWDNRPIPFKIYTEFPSIPLPSNFPIPALNAISAINNIHPPKTKTDGIANIHEEVAIDNTITKDFTLKELASLLFFSAGITREMKFDNSVFYMRAASATGALYPIELYIVCQDLHPNLEAGVYHFNPAEFSLVQIRKGDYRNKLSYATAYNKDILNSPLTVILTSFAWRNAWKYQSRSYRHWFWDGGVIAANLLAASISLNLNSKIIMGFIDDEVNKILLLEKEKEASIVMVPIGVGLVKKITSDCGKTDSLYDLSTPKIRPLSRREIQYPDIWKIHQNSKLFDIDEVKEWIKSGLGQTFNLPSPLDSTLSFEQKINRQPLSIEYLSSTIPTIGEVILKRGSTRKFARLQIPFSILSSILYNSTRGVSMDFKNDVDTLIDIYLIANGVEGLSQGGYFFNRHTNTLDHVKDNASREIAGYLCLNQPLFSDASVVLFLMADLNKIMSTLGNRGYRSAQFESGIVAGKIYLSSYTHGIGASGSTFFDDSVSEFFSPHAKDKSTMIAVGIGIPAYKANSGRVLPVRFTREQLFKENVANLSF